MLKNPEAILPPGTSELHAPGLWCGMATFSEPGLPPDNLTGYPYCTPIETPQHLFKHGPDKIRNVIVLSFSLREFGFMHLNDQARLVPSTAA